MEKNIDKISTCKLCGALYKQNRQNNTLYCYKHRGYIKKEKNGVSVLIVGKK